MSISGAPVFYQMMQSSLQRAYPSGLPSNQVLTQFSMPYDTVSLPDSVKLTWIQQGYPYGWGETVAEYAALILSDKPVAYYRMDDTGGTTVRDWSGHGYTGTIIGGVTEGQPGALFDGDAAMKFSGGEITTSYVMNLPSWSVEFWLKIPSSWTPGAQDILTAGNPTGNDLGLEIGAWNGVLNTIIGNGTGWAQVTPAFPQGAWNHYVATYDGTHLTVWMNGVSMGSITFGFAASSSALNIAPTNRGTTDSIIDEVAIYNYALTLQQVAAHYNAGNGMFSVTEPYANCWLLRLEAFKPTGSGVTLSAAIGAGTQQAIQRIDPAQTLIYADDLFTWSEAVPLGRVGMQPWGSLQPYWNLDALWPLESTEASSGVAWNDPSAVWMGPAPGAEVSAPIGEWLLRKWMWFGSTGSYAFYFAADGIGNLFLDGSPLLQDVDYTSPQSVTSQVTAGWHLVSISCINQGVSPNPTGVIISVQDSGGNVLENGSYHSIIGTQWQTSGYINPTWQSVRGEDDMRHAWYVIPAADITSEDVTLQVGVTGTPTVNWVFWYSVAPWRWDGGGEYDGSASANTPAQVAPVQTTEVVG